MASLLLGWPLVWLVFLLAEVGGFTLVLDVMVVAVVVVVMWLALILLVVVVVVGPLSISVGGEWGGSSMINSSLVSYLVQVCWTTWAHRRFFLWVLNLQDPPHW